MENKPASILVCLASLAVIFLLVLSLPMINYSHGQSLPIITTSSPSFVFLGYGLSTLSPAQQGSPIYTANDSLWVYSSLDQEISVTLTSPNNNSSISSTIPPTTAASIYTFSGTDQPGTWTLIVTLQNSSSYTISIPLVETPENQASAALSEYSIQNGEINLGFSVNAPNSYNLEACLTSASGNGTLYVSQPTNVGTGQMAIALDAGNNTAIVSAGGSIATPFSFWFEIDYSYGYTSSLANETISRNLAVSRSNTVLFNSTTTQSVSLPILTNMRPGRYVIRGYFDSASGFETTETRALLLNDGRWFWLSSCDPFSISGSTFSKQVNLAQNPSSWPTLLYFMYQTDGIDGYSVVPLQINLARLDFLGQPGNVELSEFTYSIANNSDIEASGTFSGSVYVIAKSYPLAMTVTPMIGLESLSPLEINVLKPLTDSQFYIPIGKLTVLVLNNSKPDVGVLIAVSNSQGASLSASTLASGSTSFFLPGGFYNITISRDSLAREGNATVNAGSNTIVQFSLTSSGVPTSYLELLFIPLVVGLGLNVWAWIISPGRSRYRLE